MFGFRSKKPVPMSGVIHHQIPEMTFFSGVCRDGPQGVIFHQPEKLEKLQFFLCVLRAIKKLVRFREAQKDTGGGRI